MATIDSAVRIGAGSSEDLGAVMTIMEAAFGDQFGEAWTRSQLSGILPMAGVSLKLAWDRDSGEAVGFSLHRTVADESELLLIGVKPEWQRRAVGGSLLSNVFECARAESVQRIHLEVRDGNPAIAVYRAAGFAPVRRRRNYYLAANGQRYDAITLARQL